ncbi:hypothetical protein [Brevibacillus fluminis]|nr:hypothetical protein [Brevibacillus fluminis]
MSNENDFPSFLHVTAHLEERTMKMARRTFGFILLLSMFSFLTGFSAEEKELKATYLWQTTLIATEPDQILTFAKEQGVNLVYLKIDITRKASYYQSFIKKASEAGVKVQALGGLASWGLEQNRPKIMAFVDWVIAYNKSAADTEKISGIHFDIEPYVMPEWKTAEQASIMRQWMGNVDAYIERAQLDPTLEIGCDIPFWLDKTYLPDDSTTTISEWLISKHDQITVMAYRDRADGSNSISSLVPQELNWADQLGKKALVAVETKESSEGNFVTFYEEGKTYMNAELSKLPSLLSPHPSYVGTAIHSYEYWKPLKE